MRLNTNLASLNVYREHVKILKGQSTSLERISSGNKINKSGDGANSIAKSERLRMQIRGLQMANRNVQDGVSMLQAAEGSLDSVSSMLQRMRELSVSAGGATSEDDKKIINDEIQSLIEGIRNTIDSNDFNGINILKDEQAKEKLNMISGTNVGESISIPLYNLSPEKLGDADNGQFLSDINLLDEDGIGKALDIIDKASAKVNDVRSMYGALENRFESSMNITLDISISLESAESEIRDADIALEMVEYSKYSLLVEAGNAMMVQSNKFPQDVLRILENVRR